ncbi:MAG: hypothetical protein WBQ75_21090 [Acetobacteraceae bacterium]
MQTGHAIAHDQFRVFAGIGDHIKLTDEERRRMLLLSADEYSAWSRVPQGAPLPAQPDLPVMLLRLGTATHRLAMLAEQRGALA